MKVKIKIPKTSFFNEIFLIFNFKNIKNFV
jgi:hypothetical protein